MKKILRLLAIALLVLLPGVTAVRAGTGYDLASWTVDGGGGLSQGPGYALNGTTGQAEAGSDRVNSVYALHGGFWHPAGSHTLFLPRVVK